MKCAFDDGIPEDDMVHVQLWDKDRWSKDDLIAEMEIRIGDIVKDYPVDEWFDMNFEGKHAGKIHLRSWKGSRASRIEEEVDEAKAAKRHERRGHKKSKKNDSSSSSSSSSDEERDAIIEAAAAKGRLLE